ncbi:hypothetical protein [Streptococcus hepaticus]
MNMPMVIGFINGVLLGEAVDYAAFGAENIHHVNAFLAGAADQDEDE